MTPPANPFRIRVLSLALADFGASARNGFASTLDEEERARAARFLFEEDCAAYVAAHGLLRRALTEAFGRPPAAWRFCAGAHGKPALVDAPPGAAFNLSHCRSMVVVAVGAGGARDVEPGVELGVDVEARTRAERLDIRVARRFFAGDEVARLEALPDAAARNDYFLQLWTLKEAVIKATGLGLTQPLDAFSVAPDPARLLARADSAFAPPVADWRLAQRRIAGHEVAAAAIAPGRDVAFEFETAAIT
jgi:4'-phosphopantetheinyl transferase